MNTRGKHQINGNSRPEFRHAVVLGGSLAGLLAARVLSDHFEHVTLIERDVCPETPETRRGIPQANHVHGLLLRGRQVLEELFPGLQDEMIAAGAPLLDMANDISWFTRAGFGIRFPSNLKVLAFTRPLLDLHVRRRLSRNPRVEIVDNTEVIRLIPESTENRVAGVLVCPRSTDADRRIAKEIRADLIVDATGRASRAPRWLALLGYEPPEEVVVNRVHGPGAATGDASCARAPGSPQCVQHGDAAGVAVSTARVVPRAAARPETCCATTSGRNATGEENSYRRGASRSTGMKGHIYEDPNRNNGRDGTLDRRQAAGEKAVSPSKRS